MGLIHIPFFEKEHKFKIHKFKSKYITSFLFGAAFAAGWTPCVGAALGAILTLAATHPTQSFGLLFVYSLGLGIPFLIVGFFAGEFSKLISKMGPFLKYINIIFGILLIIFGILIFTQTLTQYFPLALSCTNPIPNKI
jgi:cytochrome c-type biogenesis protein